MTKHSKIMKQTIQVTDLDTIKETIANAALNGKKNPTVSYVDIRVEANEGVGAYSEDGNPKMTSLDWSLSLGIRVITEGLFAAAGYYGRQLGITDFKNFPSVLNEAITIATDRASSNSKYKEK